MKNLIVIFILLLLISCGGGIENKSLATQVDCTNNDSSSPTVAQDSIRLEIITVDNVPKEGVVVQLDNAGICVKSNSAGIVTFNTISNGEHDVHVFSPPGFLWQSIYSIQPGKIQRIRLSETVSKQRVSIESYISLSGPIVNNISGNEIEMKFYSNSGINFYSEWVTLTGNRYSVDFAVDDVPSGTSISGEILVLEYNWDPVKGERILVDSTILAMDTYITKGIKKNYFEKPINLNVTKPAVSTLLSFNSINIPNNFSLSRMYLSSRFSNDVITKPGIGLFYQDAGATNLPPQTTITAFEPTNYTEFNFDIMATRTTADTRSFWRAIKLIVKNTATKSVYNSNISIIPDIPKNQSGSQITWTDVSPSLFDQSITIGEINPSILKSSWNISLKQNSTMLELPTIPDGITPILDKGTQYQVVLTGEQDTKGPTQQDIEFYQVTTESWIR